MNKVNYDIYTHKYIHTHIIPTINATGESGVNRLDIERQIMHNLTR